MPKIRLSKKDVILSAKEVRDLNIYAKIWRCVRIPADFLYDKDYVIAAMCGKIEAGTFLAGETGGCTNRPSAWVFFHSAKRTTAVFGRVHRLIEGWILIER